MSNQRSVEHAKTESERMLYFVLCKDCFWCASVFTEHTMPERCLKCGKDVETMSINENERYTVDIKKKNVVLCFS